MKQIVDYLDHNSIFNILPMMYSFMVKIAVVGCITWYTKLSSTSREINILYGFTMKQDSSIWLLSLQILNYIYWHMTYCALSLYLNCILCCFPFSCLVNKLYRLWIKFQIKTFNANKIDSSHLSILCELNLCLDIDIFFFCYFKVCCSLHTDWVEEPFFL